jgi:O-antigen ligase
VALAALAFVVAAAQEGRRTEPVSSATPTRLASIQSNRYDYWRVAARTFVRHPLAGTGSGGFAVEWLRERPIRESARNAHSLYLETAAELGLVGLAALALFAGGIASAARRALLRARPAAAGPLAGLSLLAFHAGIDWDWQIPAVTLVALTLAAALLVLADSR